MVPNLRVALVVLVDPPAANAGSHTQQCAAMLCYAPPQPDRILLLGCVAIAVLRLRLVAYLLLLLCIPHFNHANYRVETNPSILATIINTQNRIQIYKYI